MRRALSLALVGLTTLTTLNACGWFSGGCPQGGGGAAGVIFHEVATIIPPPPRMQAARGQTPTMPRTPTYRITGCADSECVVWEISRSQEYWLRVVLEDVTGPTSVIATLTVIDTVTGAVAFDASTPVDLVEYYPYGPQCSDATFQAVVVPTPDGELVPAPLY